MDSILYNKSNTFNTIPYDLVCHIFSFLQNYDAFKLASLNVNYKKIAHTSWFFNYIKYRYHPAVFNKLDNFCFICNTKPVILELNSIITHCKHT